MDPSPTCNVTRCSPQPTSVAWTLCCRARRRWRNRTSPARSSGRRLSRRWRRSRRSWVAKLFWSGDWSGMTGISAGPRSGIWTGAARRTVGKFAAPRSMKPFDAASAARPRSCQAMAIRSPDRRQRVETGCIDFPSMLPYPARKPPSTATTVPVAYCDAGIQRKATAPATSSGCPHRLKAVRSAMRW